MRVIVANSVGRLDNGAYLILYPSRCDVAVSNPPWAFYPYQLAYLTALLKRELPGAEVKLVDGNLRRWYASEYLPHLAALEPDWLVCECSAVTYGAMTGIVQALKAGRPGLRAILTGPYGPFIGAERTAADGWDYLVTGEYEAKVLAIIQGQPEPQGFFPLDWLPWPDDDDVCRLDYRESVTPWHAIQVYGSRGCPLGCVFCVVPTYYGGHGVSHRGHRTRAVEDICDELDYLARKYAGRFDGFMFYEDTHNATPAWLASLAEAIIRRGLNRFHYDGLVGYWPFTEDLVKVCARAGYNFWHMGIETLEPGLGKQLKKVVFPDKLMRVLEWFKQYGMGVWGTSLIGAPGSSWDIDLATLEGLAALKDQGLLTKVQYSLATPLPGTPFYAQARREGWLVTDDLTRHNWLESVVNYPHYSAAQMNQMRAMYARVL